jgi:hypothetical protein
VLLSPGSEDDSDASLTRRVQVLRGCVLTRQLSVYILVCLTSGCSVCVTAMGEASFGVLYAFMKAREAAVQEGDLAVKDEIERALLVSCVRLMVETDRHGLQIDLATTGASTGRLSVRSCSAKTFCGRNGRLEVVARDDGVLCGVQMAKGLLLREATVESQNENEILYSMEHCFDPKVQK